MSVNLDKPYVPPLMVARADQVEPSAQTISFMVDAHGPVTGLLVGRTMPLAGDTTVTLHLQEITLHRKDDHELVEMPQGEIMVDRDLEVLWWAR